MKIVSLSGVAGVGKDYLAQHYFRKAGFLQFSFAWHFKIWLVATGQATYEEVFVTKPPHVRKLLQEEGTERGRNIYGEQIWCNTALVWMRTIAENSNVKNFIIPDVRFPNEVDFILGNGGSVYRILAPNRAANSPLDEKARLHISETALDDYPLDQYTGLIWNDYLDVDTVPAQMAKIIGRDVRYDT